MYRALMTSKFLNTMSSAVNQNLNIKKLGATFLKLLLMKDNWLLREKTGRNSIKNQIVVGLNDVTTI